jgi:2,3-bisphosphoglycerate-independent phosphoglycerate mutase
LIKGIGLAANMKVIDVKGATGYIDTNYQGKADAATKALKDGYDYVYIHVEAPDECGHRGEIENKIKAIEDIDKYIVGSIFKDLKDSGEDFTMMVMPDHPTPISLKTHTRDMVPFLIYRNNDIKNNGLSYNENTALKSGIKIDFGYQLMLRFLGKNK